MRYLIILCALCLSLAGCGGGGGNSGPPVFNFPGIPGGPAKVSLIGRWAGSYVGSNGEQGTISLVISSNNNVSGSLHSITHSRDATVSGNVTFDYLINTTYRWSGGVVSPYSSEMFAMIAANGHMTGEWKQYYITVGNVTGTGTVLNVDLVRQ